MPPTLPASERDAAFPVGKTVLVDEHKNRFALAFDRLDDGEAIDKDGIPHRAIGVDLTKDVPSRTGGDR